MSESPPRPPQSPPPSAMSPERFEDAVAYADTFVGTRIRTVGTVTPMLHILCTASPDLLWTFSGRGIDEMEQAIGVLQAASRKSVGVAALFVTEAWLVLGERAPRVVPSLHPDRIETVCLTAVWPTAGTEVTRFHRAIRNSAHGGASLEPLGTRSSGPGGGDRVAILLREILAAPNLASTSR